MRDKALSVMGHIVDTMQPIFESSITLPIQESVLDLLFDDFSVNVQAYAEVSFPGGVENLDDHDQDLYPLPSLSDYLAVTLQELREDYRNDNEDAMESVLVEARSTWETTVTTAIEAAIQETVEAVTRSGNRNLPPLPSRSEYSAVVPPELREDIEAAIQQTVVDLVAGLEIHFHHLDKPALGLVELEFATKALNVGDSLMNSE